MKNFFLILNIILFTAVAGEAQNSATSAGTSSNLLLRFGASSRVSALSESYTGLADDINALYYNPAGLPNMRSFTMSLNHAEWLEEIRIGNLLLGYAGEKYGIGLGITHMWMPSIEGKDYLGRPTGDFNVSSSIIDFGAGYKIMDWVNAGVGIKYFQDNLADVTASGLAFDAGLYFKTFVEFLSFGIAVQNMGGKIKYVNENQDIPFTYRAGLAYRWIPFGLNITADLVKSVDTDYKVNFGVEYHLHRLLAIRAGNSYAMQGVSAPAVGAGFAFMKNYFFDYTFFNVEELGATHRVGFSYKVRPPAVYRKKPMKRMKILVPPRNIDVGVRFNSFNIIWEPVYGAQYNVYGRTTGDTSWTKLNYSPLASSSMSFRIPGEGEYEFQVSSLLDGNESKPSHVIAFNTETKVKTGVQQEIPMILPPENMTAKYKDNKISLEWDEVYGAHYFVYILVPGLSEWRLLYREPLYTNYVRIPVKRTGFYMFRVSTLMEGKESPHSEEVKLDVE